MPLDDAQLKSPSWRWRALAALAIALGITVSLLTLSPPSRDALGFSTERATAHLKVIAAEPHPNGSPAHQRVREHLVGRLEALGVEVETPESRVVLKNWQLPFRVVNIVARLRGTGSTKPVLLACHYDSRRGSFGAGDDGAAVAALVEVMRVLKEGPSLRNDVILLITDAEELGLLGAQAVVRDFDWPGGVGVVLNFDARGTSGPSIMYETSRGNAPLIREYARHVHQPTASSLTDAVYQLMPNDTDFTILKAPSPLTRPRGWQDRIEMPATQGVAPVPRVPGLNFAFIGSYANYHTPGDNLGNLSIASMRHQGLNALSLARHFADADLNQGLIGTHDAVYFDVLNRFVVRYPAFMAIPLAVAAAAASIAVVASGLRRRRVRAGKILAGLGVPPAIIAAAIAVVWPLGAWLGERLDRHADAATAGLSLLALLLTSLSPLVYRRWLSTVEVSASILLCGAALGVLAAVYLPGGSYLFLLPVMTLCATLAILFHAPSAGALSARAIIAISLAPLPSLLVVSPMIYLACLGLRLGAQAGAIGYGLRMAVFLVLLPVMALLTMGPQLRLATSISMREPDQPPDDAPAPAQ